jgi:hypothetical protein
MQLSTSFLLSRLGPTRNWQSDALSRLFTSDSTILVRLIQLWKELPDNSAGYVVKHRILLSLLTIPLRLSLSSPSNQSALDAARSIIVLALQERSDTAKIVRLTASFVLRYSPCLDPIHGTTTFLTDLTSLAIESTKSTIKNDEASGQMDIESSSSNSSFSSDSSIKKTITTQESISIIETLVDTVHSELNDSVDRIIASAEKRIRELSITKIVARLTISDIPLIYRLQPHTVKLLSQLNAGAPGCREDILFSFRNADQGVPIEVSAPFSHKLGLPLSSAAFDAVTTSLAKQTVATSRSTSSSENSSEDVSSVSVGSSGYPFSSHICITQSAFQTVMSRSELFERAVASRKSLEVGEDGRFIETDASRAALRDIRAYLHPGKEEKKVIKSQSLSSTGQAIGMMKAPELLIESQQQQQQQQSYKRKRAVLEGIEVDAKLIAALGDASSSGLTLSQRNVVEGFANGNRSMADFEAAILSLGMTNVDPLSGVLDFLSGRVSKDGKQLEAHLVLDYKAGRWKVLAKKPASSSSTSSSSLSSSLSSSSSSSLQPMI